MNQRIAQKLAGQSTSVTFPSGGDLFEGVMLGSVVPKVEEVMSTFVSLKPIENIHVQQFIHELCSNIPNARQAWPIV